VKNSGSEVSVVLPQPFAPATIVSVEVLTAEMLILEFAYAGDPS
jgi:hypothetical protein